MSRLEAHYETVRERNGYDGIDFGLGDVSASTLRRRFVAVDGRDAVASALDRPTMVCTGVGMTGPPHLGTVGQILTAKLLQEAGLDVQFVIADLEPYHGGADAERVFSLAERYREFVLDVGFDPDRGVLRTQDEARDVMHTGHRLARYYDPDAWEDDSDDEEDEDPDEDEANGDDAEPEPTAWRAAVGDAYRRDGVSTEGPSSEAAGHHSAVLHAADFLHPLSAQGYEQVIVSLGVDEHGLTPWARRFRDAAPVEGTVAGLHSRMVTGLGDYPKMSKSIPGSGITLAMAPDEIRERIREPGDEYDDPAGSVVFQSMCLASEYDGDRLDDLEAACAEGGEDWGTAKAAYADYVADLAERWRATGE